MYLGKVSYGTYLWHWPVIVIAAKVATSGPVGMARDRGAGGDGAGVAQLPDHGASDPLVAVPGPVSVPGDRDGSRCEHHRGDPHRSHAQPPRPQLRLRGRRVIERRSNGISTISPASSTGIRPRSRHRSCPSACMRRSRTASSCTAPRGTSPSWVTATHTCSSRRSRRSRATGRSRSRSSPPTRARGSAASRIPRARNCRSVREGQDRLVQAHHSATRPGHRVPRRPTGR